MVWLGFTLFMSIGHTDTLSTIPQVLACS